MIGPTDVQLDALVDLAITTAGTAALAGLVALLAKFFRRPDRLPRTSQGIPPYERDLLGDDYRDHVSGYFSEKFIADTRRRMAIYSVTGADPLSPPENNESRALAGADSLIEMERTHPNVSNSI